MTNQNLPCPFCGATKIKDIELSNGFAAVQHPDCHCPLRSNMFGKEEWNSRPPHPLENDINLRCDELTNRLNEVSTELIGAKWRSLDAEKELSELKEKVREFRKYILQKINIGSRVSTIDLKENFEQIFGENAK